jgi:hypothetical protein
MPSRYNSSISAALSQWDYLPCFQPWLAR